VLHLVLLLVQETSRYSCPRLSGGEGGAGGPNPNPNPNPNPAGTQLATAGATP